MCSAEPDVRLNERGRHTERLEHYARSGVLTQLLLAERDDPRQRTLAEGAADHGMSQVWLQAAESTAVHDVLGATQQLGTLPVPTAGGALHSQRFVCDARLYGVPKDIKQLDRLTREGVRLQVITDPGQAGGRWGEAQS